MQRAANSRPEGRVRTGDHYVLGLIAEALGEAEAAKRQPRLAMKQLDELDAEDRDHPIHAGILASRRLVALEAAPEGP